MKELSTHSAPRYSREDMSKALETLRNGGVILYPTDTIWGLGCDATNPEAVEKIYLLKGRAESKAMLALVGSEGQLQSYVAHIPEISWDLIESAVEPLTIIYDHPRGTGFKYDCFRRFGRYQDHQREFLQDIMPAVRQTDSIDIGQQKRTEIPAYVCRNPRRNQKQSRLHRGIWPFQRNPPLRFQYHQDIGRRRSKSHKVNTQYH